MLPPLLSVISPCPRVMFCIVSPCSVQFPASTSSSSSSRISASSSSRVSASAHVTLFPPSSSCRPPLLPLVIFLLVVSYFSAWFPPCSCSSLSRFLPLLLLVSLLLLVVSLLLLILPSPPHLAPLPSSHLASSSSSHPFSVLPIAIAFILTPSPRLDPHPRLRNAEVGWARGAGWGPT